MSRTIYVVDDDPDVRRSTEFLLKVRGYGCRTYPSGPSFVSELPQLEAGPILADVRMKEMSGPQLLRSLRAMGVDWPVIIMTGHGESGLKEEVMSSGAFGFLEKPFDTETLESVLRRAWQYIPV